MTILDMIAEWEKGCSNTQHHSEAPEYCPECTRALIDSLKNDKCIYIRNGYSYLAYSTGCHNIHVERLQVYGRFCPFCGKEIELHE